MPGTMLNYASMKYVCILTSRMRKQTLQDSFFQIKYYMGMENDGKIIYLNGKDTFF